jgi:hypothetical protein
MTAVLRYERQASSMPEADISVMSSLAVRPWADWARLSKE